MVWEYVAWRGRPLPAQGKPQRAVPGLHMKGREAHDPRIGLLETLSRMRGLDCDDPHPCGSGRRDARWRVLDDDALCGQEVEPGGRQPIALWIRFPLLDVLTRDDNLWDGQTGHLESQSGDRSTSGCDDCPSGRGQLGEEIACRRIGDEAFSLGFLHSIEHGAFAPPVKVRRDRPQRLGGPAPMGHPEKGFCIAAALFRPAPPDVLDDTAGIDQDPVQVEEQRPAFPPGAGQALLTSRMT
jgi:hypothetical protein